MNSSFIFILHFIRVPRYLFFSDSLTKVGKQKVGVKRVSRCWTKENRFFGLRYKDRNARNVWMCGSNKSVPISILVYSYLDGSVL